MHPLDVPGHSNQAPLAAAASVTCWPTTQAAAARTWLQHAAARPQDAFRLAKRMHRAEAIARCAATTHAERRELVNAVPGARDAIAAALDATKRS
jgi:hypothetical protein